MAKASKEWYRNYYRKRKQEYVDLLGGECVSCGSVKDLEFDHVDPETKSFPISKLMNVSKERALEELQKCQLLCNPCHRAKTIAEGRTGGGWNKGMVNHGSTLYARGCRCKVCLEYNAKRNARRRERSRKASELARTRT